MESPQALPTQPAITPTHTCPPGGCDHCVKGGMPMKKEWLSVWVLVLLCTTVVMAVLLLNEKREQFERRLVGGEKGNEQVAVGPAQVSKEVPPVKPMASEIVLPAPKTKGTVSLESTLNTRRSRRIFTEQPVTLAELSQVLWSAQGVTDDKGHRTAPSAHSLYPFTVYVVVRNVPGVTAGLYQYLPDRHALGSLGLANAGDMLTSAGVQDGAQKAPVVVVLSAAYGKMVEKFPDDPKGTALLEAGHIGQNIYLQLEALKMGGVVMAGFDETKVGQALQLHSSETAVYLVPFGHPATETAPAVAATKLE